MGYFQLILTDSGSIVAMLRRWLCCLGCCVKGDRSVLWYELSSKMRRRRETELKGDHDFAEKFNW